MKQKINKYKVYAGIPVETGAHIVLNPAFGITMADIQQKIKGNIKISSRSTLHLQGKNIFIDGLELDGTLIVKCADNTTVNLKNLVVKNKGQFNKICLFCGCLFLYVKVIRKKHPKKNKKGWNFKEIDVNDEKIEEKYRIRGYILEKHEDKTIDLSDGKTHTIDK